MTIILKRAYIIISILLITNLITLGFLLIPEPEKTVQYSYVHLKGESNHWKVDNFIVSYLPTAHNFGRGTLTYIGSDKPTLPINVTVKFFDHRGKEVGSSGGQIGNRELNKPLSGGGYRETVIKNPVPIEDILKWSLIIYWNGNEEVIDLGLTSN
ncbi:hypothetical protein AM500_13315 [Bacillus sp. FJAT-18017]|uniref:hypothetical protein n=1 Tax=Bacillus sp. FJAT-18017 TaxID=1705566 RepID=UPI0006B00BE3|nr:hypothetical protein [Bacillus sp. FJAT-18017]ALC90656.1 hypothetical protein AM500_13315 [Bacillus sp. FJAT-18017]